jgi:hypothetical protein
MHAIAAQKQPRDAMPPLRETWRGAHHPELVESELAVQDVSTL